MVDVVVNRNKDTVRYDTETDQFYSGDAVSDNLEKMAGKVGLIGAANQLNQEAQEYDETLRQQQLEQPNQNSLKENNFSEEENDSDSAQQETSSPKRKKSYRKDDAKKRFVDLANKYGYEAERARQLEEALEAERYHRAAAEKKILELANHKVDRDIDEATDTLIQARVNNDFETEKQALKNITSFQTGKYRIQEDLRRAEASQINFEQETESDPREIILTQLYDSRDFQNPGFEDWLKGNPECNPFSDEFDAEYAAEVKEVKRALNKHLVATRQKATTDPYDYLDLLDHSLDIHFGRAQAQPQPMQPKKQYNQPKYNQSYDEDTGMEAGSMRKHTISMDNPYQGNIRGQAGHYNPAQGVPTSRVNRSGYSNYGANPNSAYAPLSQKEQEIVEKTPFFDERGNKITNLSEKIAFYQQEKAKYGR